MTRAGRISRLAPAVVLAFGLGAATESGQAQGLADAAIDQAERINREQGVRARQDRLSGNRQARQVTPRAAPEAPSPGSVPPGGPCLEIRSIIVGGATLIAPERVSAAVAQSEGRCLTLADLNDVLERITFLFIEDGYIAARAYLPEQDLSDGILDVTVVEGMLEDIVWNELPDAGRTEIATAFPGLRSDPVNLRDVEQGLDQINRLASNDATIALEAGEDPGASILAVRNQVSRRWQMSVSADNHGSRATGIYQARVDVGLDNLLERNDHFRFSYQRSGADGSSFKGDARPNSDTFDVGFSVPYGYWTFGLDASLSRYQSEIDGQVSVIDTSGHSVSGSGYLTRVVHRDRVSKTSLTGRFTYKDAENQILGTRIDVASRSLSVAEIELTHARAMFGGQASATLGIEQGLPVFGAFNDDTAPDGSPKGQFTLARLDLTYDRAFDLGGVPLLYAGALHGQWSNDLLFGSEQISLGGRSSIRGVREGLLFANRGLYLRNDLSVLLEPVPNAWLARTIGRLEPYVAFDIGYADPQAALSIEGGTLAGAAIGLRNRGGRIGFDLSYSDLIIKPDSTSDIEPDTGVFFARMSMSF